MTDNLLIWIAAAVVVGAIALAAQAVALIFLHRSVSQMQERLVGLLPRVDMAMTNAEKAIAESRHDIKQVTAKANQLLDMANSQMATVDARVAKLDQFLNDTTERAKIQVDRVESLVDETVGRARHTVGFLNDTVTRPIREVNAVSAGLRAAVSALFNRRPAPAPAERAAEETVTHSS